VAAQGVPAPDPAAKILKEFRQLAEALDIWLFAVNSPTSKFIDEMEKKYGPVAK